MSLSAPTSLAMTALGPIAIGGILAIRGADPSPILTVPAIVFGVIAATGPALYIATAATGHAPPLATVIRAFATAFGAFGIVLAGLVLPAMFLSLSSIAPTTTIAVTSCALAGAAILALRRLATELRVGAGASWLVFGVWAAATFGIAGRLWWSFASEVVS